MKIMTNSATAEITKLFEDSSSVLCLKISTSLHENETLKKELQILQQELRTTREQKEGTARAREGQVNTRSVGVQVFVKEQDRENVFGQECSFSLRRDEEPAGVEESENMEKVRTEPGLIKQEKQEEDFCCSDQQPSSGVRWKKTDTEPTPVGDPEELSEQHRCGLGNELSELEVVVKAEQEEEHVAQRLDQTGCEHNEERLTHLGSEFMYERDSQVWTSFTQGDSYIATDGPVCSNATEQFSQSQSVHTQHAPATVEVSCKTLLSFGASYVEGFDKMGEKLSACSEEFRSEAILKHHGQYKERLVHTVERENQTLLLPQLQQQQLGPSVKHTRGNKSPAQPHSDSQYETSSTLSNSVFNAGRKGKRDAQAVFGKKPFICAYCGKSFDRWSHLISHHRIHTGEKPYRCAQCGKCFSLKGNLVKHERVHSGYKPFGCTQCGKRFARGANLRAHHRIHTGERPYHCTQCGKSFTRQRNLVVHQRTHCSETIQL